MTNTVNWANGDTVREFNHSALELEAGKFNLGGANPHAFMHGIATTVGGSAAIGGGASAVSNSILQLGNGNLDSVCLDGVVFTPCANAIGITGPYYEGLDFQRGPYKWAELVPGAVYDGTAGQPCL